MAAITVRISVASLLQRFHGCEPEYIRTVCKGRCCDAPSRPGGSMVTIHPSEEAAIAARGGTVQDGILVTEAGCTFKTDDHLCGLHFTDDKPFGCIASPFTLNHRDCLIVRNRYRRLICYNTPDAPPAFRAFAQSMHTIFGTDEAYRLDGRLDQIRIAREHGADPKNNRFLLAYMPMDTYRMLKENDDTKRNLVKSSP